MPRESRLLDDFARFVISAANALSDAKEEADERVREEFEQFLSTLNLVTRDDFELVRALAEKTQNEQEAILSRLAQLEAELAALKKKPAKGGKPAQIRPANEPTKQ